MLLNTMEVFFTLTFIGFMVVTCVCNTDTSTNDTVKQIYDYQSESYNSAITEKSTRSPSDSRNENCKQPKPKCTENEIEVACVNSVCEHRNCSDIGKPIKCVRLDTKKCLKGCICKDKYLRDDRTGKCIPENQCPNKKCGPNEIYDICPPTCPPQRCDVDERVIRCAQNPKPGDEACKPGCRCIDDYKRNNSGVCIPKEECHNKCGPNEIYDTCPPTCPPQRCDVDERIIRCAENPKPGDEACKPGCRCIDDYKRNNFGECIPKEECPPIQPTCGPDEEYNECANGGCGRWECSQPGPLCIDLVEGGCVPGCRCAEPLLRADDGSCVPADQCPPPIPSISCGPDEEYNECANGGCGRWECWQQGQICIDPIECVPGCRCKEPLLRAEDGSCVPADQCPPICNGQNEAIGCHTLCPESCETIGKNCTITDQEMCTSVCRCKAGFYRNKIGECITEEQCLKCTGPHEYFSCGSACDNVCESLSTQNQTNCPIINIVCNQKCYCEENFARNSDNICIPIKDCPAPIQPTCGPDEKYNACSNGGCGRWKCSQQGPLCIELVEGGCVPGCRCVEPLLRADDGTCVPADQCPPICNGRNEVIGCRTLCPETCESIGKNCTIIEPAVCIPACRCEPGFYRNENGDCVSEEQCSYNCGPNEIYDVCPRTCPPPRCDFDEKVTLCLPIPEPGDEACKPGCRCIDNYKQNASGVCIPKEECPPTPTISCRHDEVYNECANGGCGRWECSQQGQICIDPIEGGCVPGCRCAEPLLRAEDGTCVPADQCPPICNGQNEVVGCHSLCPETCETIGKNCTITEQEMCTCVCRCKAGFYRNKIGECVTEEQCLKCTGPHEYFSCGSACDNVCESLSTQNQTNCPIINIVCNQKCYCEENFARNSDNICIPIKDCPDKESGIQKFTEGNNVFNGKFLKVTSDINAESSAIYSPFSLLFLLAQLALYATGISKQQLFNVLNLQSENLIRSTIPLYLDEFNSQINVSLDLAERVYGNMQYEFSKKFLMDTKNIFKAEAQNLDFSKSSQAAKTINDWIALQTHDLIQNLVSPDTLDINTRLVLVNAIYFEGNWIYQFPKENTKQRDFYINKNKTVKVNMMNQIGSFNYAEINKPNIQILELPYENRNLTYLICLPKCKDGIDELINALEDTSFSVIKTAIGSLKSRRMDVSIPSMEITTTTNLENVLRKLNVTAIFDPETAGLGRILEKPEQLFVSSATQKATIIVNETGTKAAAANAIVVGVTAVQEPVEITKFVADHTFAYFILYKGTPIFCGIFKGPQ